MFRTERKGARHGRSTSLIGAALTAGLGLALAGSACTGADKPLPPEPETMTVDKALFQATWPMQVVDEKVRVAYEEPDWVAHTLRRDYRASIALSDGTADLGTARFHADAAAMFRQATLAAAQAYVEYFDPPLARDYDPVEKVHLLLVGKSLTGDFAGAKAQLDAVRALGDDSPVSPWAAPWLAWYDNGATWPIDLAAFPSSLPPVQPGEWPEVGERPSYVLEEQEPGTHEVSLDDPVLLLQLALWHDAAAKQAAGDQAELVDVYGARYRLPIEGPVTSTAALPLEIRFGSDYLHENDAAFMAALYGPQGLAAVDAFKDTSFLAAVVVAARGSDGKVDNVKAVDIASELRKNWKDEQARAINGQHASHAIFADVAVAALYRNLALVAELEGDRETSGKLRIAAKDMGERDAAAAPEGLLALTAWDADNQYTLRGSEIIHQQARWAPSLEVVRTAFDLLGIRVGSTRGGGGPGL